MSRFFIPFIIYSLIYLYCLVAETHAAFDDQFSGARAFAMGGAFTAVGNESDGLLVNPALISNVTGRQLSATTARLHLGMSDESEITQNLVSYAGPHLNNGGLGVLWKRLNAGGLYSENYVVVGIAKSYAFGAADKQYLELGTSVKLLNWDTAPTIGADGRVVEDLPGNRSLTFDGGIIFRPSANIPIALSVHNFSRPDIASSQSPATEHLPRQVTLGIGILGGHSTWGMDLVFRQNQVDVGVGLEHQFKDGNLLLRGGFRLENLAWGTNLTLGGGYRPRKQFRIDYGFVLPISGIERTLGSHRFSVVYDF